MLMVKAMSLWLETTYLLSFGLYLFPLLRRNNGFLSAVIYHIGILLDNMILVSCPLYLYV